MDRIYTPSALYPQTLQLQLKLGTAATIRKSVGFFSLYRVAQSQPCVKDTGSAEFRWTKKKTQRDAVCLCVQKKRMAKPVGGGGHVILASNHERQVQVLVASCVYEKSEKAEVKAIKCAKCCKTAHNRQRRQQFRQRPDASVCEHGEETLVIARWERVQRCNVETAKSHTATR